MLMRSCAGGVVFKDESVFLLKNEKNEWVLPKGVIRDNRTDVDVAIERVKKETGLKNVNIISPAGETSYEFYSITRKVPVYNEIVWYIMTTEDEDYNVSTEDGFQDGGFYPIEDALEMVTYSQDKSLVYLSYKRYKEMKKIAI
ncbi:NUDIX domain-containing protein [Calorimonas adulescens]|uniref:NUDIX domain-containing protein n=1 Tax=Calorimonas adulescens TaxID=2606906 RepID=A0A5D8QGG5_9THEO|nr:NUDIX domain-containing protein [Calorimonas adulescens]TZE83591.1 NUDIX domain-containing protein [Calorimonas adulescens]